MSTTKKYKKFIPEVERGKRGFPGRAGEAGGINEVNLDTIQANTSHTDRVIITTDVLGSDATIFFARSDRPGVMTSVDKDKLDGIEAGAEVNVGTDISIEQTAGDAEIISSTGSDGTLLPVSIANPSRAGLATPAMKDQWDRAYNERGSQIAGEGLSWNSTDQEIDIDIESDRLRKITAGTLDPSGGSHGDIYMQYE